MPATILHVASLVLLQQIGQAGVDEFNPQGSRARLRQRAAVRERAENTESDGVVDDYQDSDEADTVRRPSRKSTRSVVAQRLLNDWLNPGADNTARETDVALVDVIGRTSPGETRTRAVEAYWDWVLAYLDFVGSQQEKDFIDQRRDNSVEGKAAHFSSIARVEDAKLTLLEKLLALEDFIGLPHNPDRIPTDVPFVGAYDTKFDRLFRGQSPADLRRIHLRLPLAHKVVLARANSTDAAKGLLLERPSLEAIKTYREQRRAFLDAVRDYNLAITRYAMAVGGSVPDRESVAKMLIMEPTQMASRGRNLR